ncbi:MAG: hypothetical protein WBX15_11425 [Thermoanaerobaculia bacterium]
MQLKRAVGDVGRFVPSDLLRARVKRRVTGWRLPSLIPLVAGMAAVIIGAFVLTGTFGKSASGRELADLHATILASANPVDVLSTDRHTVKPWFEGRLPFSFPIPEMSGTPYHVIGGRVVYVHNQPVAYIMVGKARHRLSLFVAMTDLPTAKMREFECVSWSNGGLNYVLVGDVPRTDLNALRELFVAKR